MQDMIKEWSILSLLPMCTNDAGLSINVTIVKLKHHGTPPKQLHTFVANRLSQIHDVSSIVSEVDFP